MMKGILKGMGILTEPELYVALKICLMNQKDFSKLSGSSCQSPNPDSNELEFEPELTNIWQPEDAQRNVSGEWNQEVGGTAEKLQINFVLTFCLWEVLPEKIQELYINI